MTVFATVYLLQIWRHTKTTGSLLAACFLAGYCFAIKYTGILVLPLVSVTIAWEMRRRPRWIACRTILMALAVMAIVPLPYLIRNWVWFHNPVAPFGNSVFRNPYFHVSV